MPTKDRLRYLPRAIRCFLAQTYQPKELLILDDGAEGAEALIPDDPQIRYARCSRSGSIGAKRNLACDQARGEYIAHWDDDDWSHPARISTILGCPDGGSAAGIPGFRADRPTVAGFRQCLFWDESRSQGHLYTGAPNYVLGTSLCYRKDWWERNKFPHLQLGEDNKFVKAARPVLRVLDGMGMMVATTHRNGTSPRSLDRRHWQPVERAAIPEDYWNL